jgi:amidase
MRLAASRRLARTLSALVPSETAATTEHVPLYWRGATQQLRAIRAGELLPSTLLELYIGRVETMDSEQTNAVVVRDFARARKRAVAADEAAAAGEWWGPLHGLPLTVKDNLDVAGLPTSRGDVDLASGTSAVHSDAAVQRLEAAGAIVFGKTNLPLQANDIQSFNDAFGTTNNPHDLTRTPGGSSGGSAAAVAAGLSPVELGTDIGGSLRFPSHCCGIYAHKPTFGLVPKRGGDGVPAEPIDLWVIGPLARSAEDLRTLMTVLADPAAAELPAGGVAGSPAAEFLLDLTGQTITTLKGCRVAVWGDDTVCPVGESVAAAMDLAVRALRSAGACICTDARPAFDPAHSHRTYLQLLGAATASRMGPEASATLLSRSLHYNSLWTEDDVVPESGLGITDSEWMEVSAMTMRHARWLAVNEQRAGLRMAWAGFFKDVDAVIMPIAPVPAFTHDQDLADAPYWRHSGRRVALDVSPARAAAIAAANTDPALAEGFAEGNAGEFWLPYERQVFWAGLPTVCHLPVTAVPVAPPAGAVLPCGFQVVGREWGDGITLRIAELLAAHCDELLQQGDADLGRVGRCAVPAAFQ